MHVVGPAQRERTGKRLPQRRPLGDGDRHDEPQEPKPRDSCESEPREEKGGGQEDDDARREGDAP